MSTDRNEELRQLTELPLSIKVDLTRQRIREWVNHYGLDNTYISFSGGKDSTVLMDIARELYPGMKAMFVDTGLEYPQIRTFVKGYDDVDIVRPRMNFRDVIVKYGYPIISKEVSEALHGARIYLDTNGRRYAYRMEKLCGEAVDKNGQPSSYNLSKWRFLLDAPFLISHMCCVVMKKTPAHRYYRETGRVGITGQQANESRLRREQWMRHGCNGFDLKIPVSNPMSFWTSEDVLAYISYRKLDIASPYGRLYIKSPDTGDDTNNAINDDINNDDINVETLSSIDAYRGLKLETTGCERTGCVFCLFGISRDRERLLKLKEVDRRLYDYVMDGGQWQDVYLPPNKDRGAVEHTWWMPSNKGLGYRFVVDWLNEHGDLGIKY